MLLQSSWAFLVKWLTCLRIFNVRMRYSSTFEWENSWNLLSYLLLSPEFIHKFERLERQKGIWVRIWNSSHCQDWKKIFYFKNSLQEREGERPNSRKQVWSNWYQVSSTWGTEAAFLPWQGLGTQPHPSPEYPNSGPHRPQALLARCFYSNHWTSVG